MKILGLDLGTNSVGGSLVNIETYGEKGEIIWMGSRIVPIDGAYLQKFESGGQIETKAAKRRMKRMPRRLKFRYKLRRTRLIKSFKALKWVDESFPEDFKKMRQISPDNEFDINKYLPFEESTIQEATNALGILNKEGKLNVPTDWIVYYIRKKALYEKISVTELARILYMMNQRRGFKSSRKDIVEVNRLSYSQFMEYINKDKYIDEEGKELETKFVEVTKVKSVELKDDETDKKGYYTYIITPESKIMYQWEEKRKAKPDWVGKEFRFLVTQKTSKNGAIKQLKPEIPTDEDWTLTMTALAEEMDREGKLPGEFFFDKLSKNPNYKIRQQVIERSRYKNELEAIWKKQLELNMELKELNKNTSILNKIAKILYPTQAEFSGHKYKELISNNLLHLFKEDIIYYQRDLKSQKNQIDECRFEKKEYVNPQLGMTIKRGYKVAPKSCPEFQEFRIWQDINNMRIVENERSVDGNTIFDIDVTDELLTFNAKSCLYILFDKKNEIRENDILKMLGIRSKDTHHINLYANRTYLKGNETKNLFRKVFAKHNFDGEYLLENKDTFYQLWHIIYSIKGKNAEKGIKSALINPANNFKFPENIIDEISTIQELPKQYAAYSSKAIKKFLPLMRSGQFWNSDDVKSAMKKFFEWRETEAFEKLGNKIKSELREFDGVLDDFQGLQLYKSSYIIYGRHSERESDFKYTDPDQINIMELVPNNCLRNPIVEQIIRETLFVVKDVWKKYGQPDEIHIEMARDLKKTMDERKKVSEIQYKNFEEKQHVKKLLYELFNEDFIEFNTEGIQVTSFFERKPNPESPLDIEKFLIWKSGSKEGRDKLGELFKSGKNQKHPTKSEIKKYILWQSQQCKSPYTGKYIPLSKLFTSEYEIEHIIPRKKLKNDSFNNFIICETGVNKVKDNDLARVFIQKYSGGNVEYGGKKYSILSEKDYIMFCSKTFAHQRQKLKNLLTETVPEDFIERQINDTRYITRKVAELLYPFAKNKEGIVFTTGSISSTLKEKWGLNSIWKDLMRKRFQRLGEKLNQKLIIADEQFSNKFHFIFPEENQNNSIKRIDHRHHALDALIIALTTRAHIKYLNSLNSHEYREKYKYLTNKGVSDFIQPWPSFSKEAKEHLEKIIVSFKTNKQLIKKPINYYKKWIKENGEWNLKLHSQKESTRWWSVKTSMFKENPYGIIFEKRIKTSNPINAFKTQLERYKGIKDEEGKPRNYIYNKVIREQINLILEKVNYDFDKIKEFLKSNKLKTVNDEEIKQVEIAYFVKLAAKRVKIDKSFDYKKILKIPNAERTIRRWAQKLVNNENLISKPNLWPLSFLLKMHLDEYNGRPNEAFNGEGLEALFKKNNGRTLKTVTISENKSNEIEINGGIWETDSGGNNYFIIYDNVKTGERIIEGTLPIMESIRRLTDNNGDVNNIATPKEGCVSMVLSPNDLVYVPDYDEDIEQIDWNNHDRKKIAGKIYKVQKFNDKTCYFIPHNFANLILNYNSTLKIRELGSQNCSEKTIDETTTIKERCIKVDIDRLGNIKPLIFNSEIINAETQPVL